MVRVCVAGNAERSVLHRLLDKMAPATAGGDAALRSSACERTGHRKGTSSMNDPRDSHLERQLRFLQALVEENASIGGDVLEIHQDTWVIHGVIPVDGEVLMAEFETYDEAKRVLDGVRAAEQPRGDGHA